MTTIAYCGRYLAADTLGVVGGNRSERPSCKIEAASGAAYATGGMWWAIRTALIDWFQLDHPIAYYPNPRGLEGCLVAVEAATRRCWVFTHDAPYPDPEVAPNAWGTGGDVALGAMAHGATAMEAVQTAMRWDIKTGGHIDYIDLEDIGKGVQRWGGTPVVHESDGECVTIHKPHAPAKSDTGANLWADACTGRLVLGNGCGQCLRCNREWWAISKQSHEAVAEGVIRITQAEVKASLARAPLVQPDIDASPTTLQAHVDAWNAASAVGDEHRMKWLDIELRSLEFPPNVQVAIVGSAGSPKRKVIMNAPAQPQA